MQNRRSFLETGTHLCAGAIAAGSVAFGTESVAATASQKILLIGLVGSENPTRANFPFVWAAALKDAGHDVRIELAGDATVLMRSAVSNSVTPVGWPPLSQALAKVIELKIPVFV
jgi:predicted peroxiredoxin